MLETLRNGSEEQKKQYAEIITGYVKACGTFDVKNANIEEHAGYQKSDLDSSISNLYLNTTAIFARNDSDFHINQSVYLLRKVGLDLKKRNVYPNHQTIVEGFDSILEYLPSIILDSLNNKITKDKYTLFVTIESVPETKSEKIILDISTDQKRKNRYITIEEERTQDYEKLTKLKNGTDQEKAEYELFMAAFIKQHGLVTGKNYKAELNGQTIELKATDITKEANGLSTIIAPFIKVNVNGTVKRGEREYEQDTTYSSSIFTNPKLLEAFSVDQIKDAIVFSLAEQKKPEQDQSELWHYFSINSNKNIELVKTIERTKAEINAEKEQKQEETEARLKKLKEEQEQEQEQEQEELRKIEEEEAELARLEAELAAEEDELKDSDTASGSDESKSGSSSDEIPFDQDAITNGLNALRDSNTYPPSTNSINTGSSGTGTGSGSRNTDSSGAGSGDSDSKETSSGSTGTGSGDSDSDSRSTGSQDSSEEELKPLTLKALRNGTTEQKKQYADFMAAFIKQHGLVTGENYKAELNGKMINLDDAEVFWLYEEARLYAPATGHGKGYRVTSFHIFFLKPFNQHNISSLFTESQLSDAIIAILENKKITYHFMKKQNGTLSLITNEKDKHSHEYDEKNLGSAEEKNAGVTSKPTGTPSTSASGEDYTGSGDSDSDSRSTGSSDSGTGSTGSSGTGTGSGSRNTDSSGAGSGDSDSRSTGSSSTGTDSETTSSEDKRKEEKKNVDRTGQPTGKPSTSGSSEDDTETSSSVTGTGSKSTEESSKKEISEEQQSNMNKALQVVACTVALTALEKLAETAINQIFEKELEIAFKYVIPVAFVLSAAYVVTASKTTADQENTI